MFSLVFMLFLCTLPVLIESDHSIDNNNVNNRSNITHSESFYTYQQKYEAICGNPATNKVLNRQDDANEDMPKEERSWSLHSDAMKHFLGAHKHHYTGPATNKDQSMGNIRYCHGVEDILLSSETAVGRTPPCRIHWLSPDAICKTLSKYASIELIGDSLTRHMNGGLSMILTGDFQYGSYGLNFDQLSSQEKELCQCDGQFSESKLCRLHCVDRVDMSAEEFRRLHHCPGSDGSSPHPVSTVLGAQKFEDVSMVCADQPSTSNLRFLWFQGGTHDETDPKKYYSKLKRMMDSLKRNLENCPHKTSDHFRIVFTGVPIVSPAVENKYPLQIRSRAVDFYHEMARLLHNDFPQIVTVSFLRLTEYASNHGYTADGFHQLSDTNLIKAMTMLNLMRAMAADPYYNVSLLTSPEPTN